MIIQIDHIALATSNFEKSTRLLSSLSYQNKFCENGVKNPRIKKGLVKNYLGTHNLSFFLKGGSLNIELLNHVGNRGENGYITPLFENVPDELVRKRYTGDLFEQAEINGLDIPVYVKKNSKISGFRFNKLVIKTNRVEDSINFWRNFGFKKKGSLSGMAILEFASFYPKHVYQIYLQPEGASGKYLLDDNGFNCIAFVSSSSEKELLLYKNKGLKVTKMEQIEINGKIIKIFFVKGPSGELVEIVDFTEANI